MLKARWDGEKCFSGDHAVCEHAANPAPCRGTISLLLLAHPSCLKRLVRSTSTCQLPSALTSALPDSKSRIQEFENPFQNFENCGDPPFRSLHATSESQRPIESHQRVRHHAVESLRSRGLPPPRASNSRSQKTISAR